MKLRGFVHALQALEPRLGDIVLTGGWAWYLYRKYLTGEKNLPGEFTLDMDLVVPRTLASRPQLDEMLELADFELEMSGDEHPPVSKYSWPSTEAPEAVVEFLTPARGSGETATLAVNGVVAQQLRFLDLLLDDPVLLDVNEQAESESYIGRVRVPRVGLFVLQKALTFRRRRPRGKMYKDLFYIFDLADESRGLLTNIEEDSRGWMSRNGTAWLQNAAQSLEEDCGNPEADAIGRVVEQIPDEQRPPRRYVSETFARLVSIFRGGQS
jgi:hypothetical protein